MDNPFHVGEDFLAGSWNRNLQLRTELGRKWGREESPFSAFEKRGGASMFLETKGNVPHLQYLFFVFFG